MVLAIAVILLALFFDFSNGFHDAANVVATIITTRALSPKRALVIAAVCEFKGKKGGMKGFLKIQNI